MLSDQPETLHCLEGMSAEDASNSQHVLHLRDREAVSSELF